MRSLNILLNSMFFLSSSAFATIKNHELPQFTRTLHECETLKAGVLHRFQKIAGAEPLSAICFENPGRSFNLTIQYNHDSVINAISTYNQFGNPSGLFVTHEACVAALAAEQETFQKATGLEPVAAYCFSDYHQETRVNAWTLRIDSFGEPRLKPFTFSRHFYDPIVSESANPEARFSEVLTAFGAVGIRTIVRRGPSSSDLFLSYYASRELPFFIYDRGYFNGPNHLNPYLSEFSEIYARAGGQMAAEFALHSSYSDYWSIFAIGTVLEPLTSHASDIHFSSLESCESERAKTENNWRNTLGKNVVGSVCAIEDVLFGSRYSMRIFWLE